MNAVAKLEQMLRHWQELTEAESRAIETEAWAELADAQRRKAELKEEMTALDPQGRLPRAPLRSLVAGLLDLERQNLEQLHLRMARLQQQISGLDANRRTLHRIKGAYVTQDLHPAGCFGTA